MMRTPMAELWSVAAWIGLVVGVILVVAPQASAQIFEMDRIPTISEVPEAFVGTWHWTTPRQDCGNTRDSYGDLVNREDGTLCQWPIADLERVLNGRGRAWRAFTLDGADELISPRWSCAQSSLGTALTEVVYERSFYKTPDSLIQHYEHSNWIREIWMDGRSHPPLMWQYSHGHPIGWMEGDTLVVETTNFTWDPDGYDDHSHMARSHLARWTERYRLIGDRDHMEIAITVYDPMFLREEFTFVGEYERTDEPLIGTWDCDPESAINELFQTTINPYPDDPTPELYLNR